LRLVGDELCSAGGGAGRGGIQRSIYIDMAFARRAMLTFLQQQVILDPLQLQHFELATSRRIDGGELDAGIGTLGLLLVFSDPCRDGRFPLLGFGLWKGS